VAGYGAVFPPGALAFVDPACEGAGIGSALLEWIEGRAGELGRTVHRQMVAEDNRSAHALLSAAGYRQVRSNWLMARGLDVAPQPPAPPDGVILAAVDPDRDARDLHAADAAAFAGHPGYEPSSFESFRDEHLAGPELDPTLSCVARRDGALAGFAVCRRLPGGTGFIDLLAVAPAQRRRGLGTALLLHSFAAFAAANLREARLEVASDNPRAVALYERAGMTVRRRTDIFEKPAGASRPWNGPMRRSSVPPASPSPRQRPRPR
jgi:mycothiol synthase